MDLSIREVRPDDAEAIIRILNPIIEAGIYTALDTPLTGDTERTLIMNFPQRGIFHVAERDSDHRIIGLQTLEPYASYTHAFDHVAIVATFVNLAEHHRGTGRHLSEISFAAARQKGFEKIFTYVRADNQTALSFYLSLGFRIIGTAQRQARCREKYVDEILIEKFI
jgi:L-amino acid N-acyltransferase YncA